MSMRTKEDQALRAANTSVRNCGTAGPWGAICTDHSGHNYSCYDGTLDLSFNRHWFDDMDVPPENHPYDRTCTDCK
jgi:hypothetical protein